MIRIVLASIFVLLLCSCVSTKEEVSPISSGAARGTVVPAGAVFNPSFKGESSDPYFDAGAIYDSSPKAAQGVYRFNGLVFVIVCIDTAAEQVKHLNGTAMLRSAALLRKQYPHLPSGFYLRNRVVEKTHDEEKNMYRYAVVFREKEILQKTKK